MLPGIAVYVTILFLVCVLYVMLIYWQGLTIADNTTHIRVRNWVFGCMLLWIMLHFFLGYTGFYRHYNEIPPRIALFVGIPVVLLLGYLMLSKTALPYLKAIPLKWLLWLHLVRLPVEVVLYACFVQGALPEVMTFTGRNYDIVAGLTAPLVAYFGAQKGVLQKRHLMLWNFICIGLLLNVVTTAIFSVPFPFQKFGFAQPNIAVFYAPFTLLPAFIVPLVLLSHIIAIAKLRNAN